MKADELRNLVHSHELNTQKGVWVNASTLHPKSVCVNHVSAWANGGA